MDVYLISAGCYSDWHPTGAFSSRELAEAAIAAYKEHGAKDVNDSIDVFTLDAMPYAPDEHGLKHYYVRMRRDGDAIVDQWADPLAPDDDDDVAPYGGRVPFHISARDEQHAVKIANERRIALIASDQWCDDWDAWMEKKYGYSPARRAAERAAAAARVDAAAAGSPPRFVPRHAGWRYRARGGGMIAEYIVGSVQGREEITANNGGADMANGVVSVTAAEVKAWRGYEEWRSGIGDPDTWSWVSWEAETADVTTEADAHEMVKLTGRQRLVLSDGARTPWRDEAERRTIGMTNIPRTY